MQVDLWLPPCKVIILILVCLDCPKLAQQVPHHGKPRQLATSVSHLSARWNTWELEKHRSPSPNLELLTYLALGVT